MAQTTIQWCSTLLPNGTFHPGWTFNTHWGCTEQGPECDNCYARVMATRWGFDIWGNKADRRFFQDEHFKKLLSYNAAAERLKTPLKVFCNSMSDLYEARADLVDPRRKLYDKIKVTNWLNYLCLTKLPNQINRLAPEHDLPNVWYGTSVGVDKSRWRIDRLNKVKASVRFLSLEPLLQPLPGLDLSGISWAVIGGESGNKARPCDPDWIFDFVQQCRAAGVAPFVKQLGTKLAKKMKLKDGKGGDINEWPEELRVREFPVQNLVL